MINLLMILVLGLAPCMFALILWSTSHSTILGVLSYSCSLISFLLHLLWVEVKHFPVLWYMLYWAHLALDSYKEEGHCLLKKKLKQFEFEGIALLDLKQMNMVLFM
jgi:hypothetical protein